MNQQNHHQSTLKPAWSVFSWLLGALGAIVPVAAAPIYVAPNGNDNAAGTHASPIATIERAQQMAQAAIARGENAEVVLRGGTYELRAPLTLGKADSGTAQKPVLWRAAHTEIVHLSGGRTLTKWQRITDAQVRERLDASVRDKVLQLDLKAAGITDYGDMSGGMGKDGSTGLELFLDDVPMHVSRYPNAGFIKMGDVLGATPIDVRGTRGTKEGIFRVEDKRVARWANEKDARVLGYWFWDWADERHKIASIDPNTLTVTLAGPSHGYGYRKNQYFYGFNLLSEIDQPGEWYLDREKGIAYVLPPKTPQSAMVSLLPSLLKLDGAAHISFRNIVFEGAREHIVTINNSQNCSLQACTLRNSSKWAVRISEGRNCAVRGCDIYNTGDGGVSLVGGDRATLTPANHVVENCHIHHYSRWNRTYKPAIEITGVGNRALRNLIDHAPHQAMQFGGNDHLIEGNEIHNVCEETNDAGAIYGWNDWAARGNIIRNNYLHHIYGREAEGANGVYLDDNFSSATIENNIFEAQMRPIHLGGGRDHKVVNNLFVDCFSALHIDARGLGWRTYGFDELKQKLEQWPYTKPPWSARYPKLLTLLNDEPMAPKGNLVARNVMVNSTWDDIEGKAKPYVTMQNNLLDASLAVLQRPQSTLNGPYLPPRVNAALQAVKAIGFAPIATDRIGLYKSAERANWPVLHTVDKRAWPQHGSASSTPHAGPPLRVPRLAAPKIDGVANAAEYSVSLPLAEMPNREKLATPPGMAWLAHDGKELYVAVTIPIAKIEKLVANGDWGAADAVEIVFRNRAVAPAAKPGPIFILQGFAGGNSRFSLDGDTPQKLAATVYEAARYAAKIGAKSWTAEWSVPLQAAGIVVKPDTVLDFNIGARRLETEDWLVWAGTGRENWRLDGSRQIVLQP